MILLLLLPILFFGQTQPTVDIAAYFPVRQGDVWTYDWESRVGGGPPRTIKRTRAFEGREFVNVGYAHRLASENGDYALFSLDAGGLFLHGAADYEREARYLFDPPVALLTRGMERGRPVVTTQLEEDGKTMRRFTVVYDGPTAITTSMGRFEDCLKVRWEMEASIANERTTYYLARGVGIVAYQVEVEAKGPAPIRISVDARLRLAQFGGRSYTKVEELSGAGRTFAAASSPTEDNAKARGIFKQASERRYAWDRRFPGFEADFTLRREGQPDITGTIRVDRALDAQVDCADASARALVHAEISQFLTYRRPRDFDETYGSGKAIFALGVTSTSGASAEIIVYDEARQQSSYRIEDREIREIRLSYGRVRFVTRHLNNVKADDGRDLATEYEIAFYSNETDALVSRTTYKDRYEKVGAYYLPVGRTKVETMRDRTTAIDLGLTRLRYLK